MKKENYSSLGLELSLNVPANVEEFDKNAGAAGRCLAEATNNVVYRGMLAEFRHYFLHGISKDDIDADTGNQLFVKGTVPIKGVEDVSGIDRKIVVVKDKDGKTRIRDGKEVTTFDPEDTEATYFKRVLAEKKQEASAYKSIADAVAAALVFNASETPKSEKGPKKLAALWKAQAKAFLLAEVNPSTGKPYSLATLQKALKGAGIEEFVPEVGTDGKPLPPADDKNIEKLGWLCKRFKDSLDPTKNM